LVLQVGFCIKLGDCQGPPETSLRSGQWTAVRRLSTPGLDSADNGIQHN